MGGTGIRAPGLAQRKVSPRKVEPFHRPPQVESPRTQSALPSARRGRTNIPQRESLQPGDGEVPMRRLSPGTVSARTFVRQPFMIASLPARQSREPGASELTYPPNPTAFV